MATCASYDNTQVAFSVQCNNKMCAGKVMVSLFYLYLYDSHQRRTGVHITNLFSVVATGIVIFNSVFNRQFPQ